LLKPPPAQLTRQDRGNLNRRLQRQAHHKPPRIVNLGRARPWALEGKSRSTWYARHPDRREHQLLGLRALLMRGDDAALTEAQNEIALRARTSQSQLLREMRLLLERQDIGFSSGLADRLDETLLD
jgi:hypothetical protein